MDYIGSKEKLNPWIFQRIARRFPDGLDGRLFLDACCGSASTSRYAARLGCRVQALDLLAFPVALANGSICDCPETIAAACDELRQLRELKPADGLFRQEYSPATKAVPGGRPFFTETNAGLLDACRQHVGRLTDNKLRDILLYCLVEALSRVSNTMGTHGAFKKIGPTGDGWKPRALERLTPKLEHIVPGTVEAVRSDLLPFFTAWATHAWPLADVVYIDPPYNNRQYGANYHLYENLVLYDQPTVHGKTGLRDWTKEGKSLFCVAEEAMAFLLQTVKAAPARLVFVSYSSDGLLSTGRSPQAIVDQLLDELDCAGVAVHMRRQRRYCADLDRENSDQPLCEYLFEVEK